MRFKRVLVTGGCGFLGQYVVDGLLEKYAGLKIRVIDLKPNSFPVFDFSGNPDVEVLLGKDICDMPSVSDAFKDVDAVIHLAGIVSFSLKDKRLLENVNVKGTENMLRLAEKNKVRRFVHVSSVAALGYRDHEEDTVDEEFEFDWSIAEARKKYYMLTKYRADRAVERFRDKGHDAVILYPGLLYGPGDVTNSSRLIRAIKDEKLPFNMPGGTNVVDVRDVAAGIVIALDRAAKCSSILLSGHNLTMKEMNRIMAAEVGAKAPRFTMPRFMNPVLFRLMLAAESRSEKKLDVSADNVDSAFRFRYFDNSKAKEELGWKPAFSFRRTVKDTVDWLEINGLLEDRYDG